MVTVVSVLPHSKGARAGIMPGDTIVSIDKNEINDVLDYRFYLASKNLEIAALRDGKAVSFKISKDEYEDIGLEFETFLMDKKHSCKNGCIFCFIDQLPKGMRDTLYFKDDDSRLSFLQGNYITLTNLTKSDIERIIKMRMSPVNISVHTTDKDLRVKMMKNKHAGDVLEYLSMLAEGNITMNCQIVLCRGINDGESLEKTMRDLSKLYPHVGSVSVVPAGLTDHRDGLCFLEPFTKSETEKIIDTVEGFADECKRKYGSRIFFCADEMYIKCERELPNEEYYEGYPQIQNGVGMLRSMSEEIDLAVSDFSGAVEKRAKISLATGKAAYPFVCEWIKKIKEKIGNIDAGIVEIENRFFGKNITVAGLIVGKDLIEQLRGRELGKYLLLPSEMLRYEKDKFLDDVTVSEVEKELGVKIVIVPSDGYSFFDAVIDSVSGKE